MARGEQPDRSGETRWLDSDDELFDQAIAQVREELAKLPPAKAPSPEDIAAMQQMLASHNAVVESITAWRRDKRRKREVR